MPYNNTPIAPTQEVTGAVALPLARVKKIIHADEDLVNCSNNAAFAITIATEQFLQYLVENTLNVVRSESKPRRNIQYKDVANTVARHDNLEFLTDVVPRTTTYRAHKQKQKKDAEDSVIINGQSALSFAKADTNGVGRHDDEMDVDTPLAEDARQARQGAPLNGITEAATSSGDV